MGMDFVLAGIKGRIIGDAIPWHDYLEPVEQVDGLWVYELRADIPNLHRKVDEVCEELKSIHPREWFSAIYVSEWGEVGYEFIIDSNGNVKVYTLEFKPMRVIGKDERVPVPEWETI